MTGGAEKVSFLSKLFGSGRNKKRTMTVEEEDHKDQCHQPAIEHATFSAQFPPPDLHLHQHNDLHANFGDKASKPTDIIFHNFINRPHMIDAEAQSDVCDYNEGDVKAVCVRKSRTLPENIRGLAEAQKINPHQQSFSSYSPCSECSSVEFDRNKHNFVVKDSKLKRRSRNSMGDQQDKQKGKHEKLNCLNKSNDKANKSMDEHSRDTGRTQMNSIKQEAIYEDIREYAKTPPTQCENKHHESEVKRGQSIFTESSECNQPDIIPYTAKNFKNSSHKTKVYRKYKEKYSSTNLAVPEDRGLEAECTNEKLSSMFKSRDNGVNCVGLSENETFNNMDSHTGPHTHTSKDVMQEKKNKPDSIQYNTDLDPCHGDTIGVSSKTGFRNHNNVSLHEDSGFNSPKGNFSLYSPDCIEQSVKKRNPHNVSNRKDGSRKNIKSCSSFKYGRILAPQGSNSYQETDLDNPYMD